MNPGSGAALIGIGGSTAAKIILTVGIWAGTIGNLTGNKFLSTIGMAIGLWGGISSIANGLNVKLIDLLNEETANQAKKLPNRFYHFNK